MSFEICNFVGLALKKFFLFSNRNRGYERLLNRPRILPTIGSTSPRISRRIIEEETRRLISAWYFHHWKLFFFLCNTSLTQWCIIPVLYFIIILIILIWQLYFLYTSCTNFTRLFCFKFFLLFVYMLILNTSLAYSIVGKSIPIMMHNL